MTYKDLLKKLKKLTPEQLEHELVVYDVSTDSTSDIDSLDFMVSEDDAEENGECQPSSELCYEVGMPYFVVGCQ